LLLAVVVQGALQHTEGLIEQIRRAGQRDVKLLHRFLPPTFPLKSLKPFVLLVEDGLLGVEDQTF
jgi:hypothetical protein